LGTVRSQPIEWGTDRSLPIEWNKGLLPIELNIARSLPRVRHCQEPSNRGSVLLAVHLKSDTQIKP